MTKKEKIMKKTTIASLVAVAAFAVISLLGLNANKADAVDMLTIGAGKKIHIRQDIHTKEATEFTGRFTYKIEEIDGQNAVSGLPQPYIELNNTPFMSETITRSIDASFSSVRVIARPGQYKMKLSCTSNVENFPCASSYYTFLIVVENVLDGNQVPTGEYTTSVTALRKVENGREYSSKLEEAYFYSEEELPPEPVYSYIELKDTVEGDLASKDDVFKYIITVDGPDSETYNIEAPLTEYEFDGEAVTSDTEITGGSAATIYLKHGERAVIGRESDDGAMARPNLVATTSLIALGDNESNLAGQILVGTAYTVKQVSDVEDYKTWIDSKELGERNEISKMVAEDPGDNYILFINSKSKPTIPEQIIDFVNTGLKLKHGAFVILGAGAVIVILIILLQRKKKRSVK